MSEKKRKRCSGCKEEKSLDSYYKNKLVLDGHSNYCVECTKQNSKKYFQRKKERIAKEESENMMKKVLLSNYTNDTDSVNADNLMKILLIEKMCNSILDELENLKKTYVKNENVITT